MTFTEGLGIWSCNPLLGWRSMPSGNVSTIIKAFIAFSFQSHRADGIYTLHVYIHHHLWVVEVEEEEKGRPNVLHRPDQHRFRVFPASCNTNWLCEIGSENEYPGHCSVVLCCEITSRNEGEKILNSFESKSHNISGNENPVEVTKERGLKGIWKLYISKCSAGCASASSFVTTIRTVPSDVDTAWATWKLQDAYISDLWLLFFFFNLQCTSWIVTWILPMACINSQYRQSLG